MTTIATLGEIHEDGTSILQKSNFEIINITNFKKENLTNKLRYVDAIILRTANLQKDVLKECKSLKIIARHGVGYDNVDINYLNKIKENIQKGNQLL